MSIPTTDRCVFGNRFDGTCGNAPKWEARIPEPLPGSEHDRWRVCNEHLQPTCYIVADYGPITVQPIFANWTVPAPRGVTPGQGIQ